MKKVFSFSGIDFFNYTIEDIISVVDNEIYYIDVEWFFPSMKEYNGSNIFNKNGIFRIYPSDGRDYINIIPFKIPEIRDKIAEQFYRYENLDDKNETKFEIFKWGDISIFKFFDCDMDDTDTIIYSNVHWEFDSLKKYDGLDIELKIEDGTFIDPDGNERTITSIPEFLKICHDKYINLSIQ